VRPQQASPDAPQASQVPAAPASVCPMQVKLAVWQVPAAPQQAWPDPPQVLQVAPLPNPLAFGLSQPSPELQGVALRQQAWSSPPQAPHMKPPSADTQPSEPVQVKVNPQQD